MDNSTKQSESEKSKTGDKPILVTPPAPTTIKHSDNTPKTTFNDKGNKK